MMHVLAFAAKPDSVDSFERTVQRLAFDLHHLERGVSDVRVMHPRCGEATFCITLLDREQSARFEEQIKPRMLRVLYEVATPPTFLGTGTLMPQAHSLGSLLAAIRQQLNGAAHYAEHNVDGVKRELAKWFPRRAEFEPFVSWSSEPGRYTRNLVYSSPEMEVLLMCWPAGSRSTIHCHDSSSCWVAAVEGEVHEVQYSLPLLDRQFLRRALSAPEGASGQCGALRVVNVTSMGTPGGPQTTYANNELGIHRIENRSGEAAITMHFYAPRLRRMKVFRETGEVQLVMVDPEGTKSSVHSIATFDVPGSEGILDVTAWNS